MIRFEMVTIVYISGYGRSGSTALDLALGSSLRVLSLGEIANISTDYFSDNLICSCGETYSKCELWGPLLYNPKFKEAIEIVGRLAYLESPVKLVARLATKGFRSVALDKKLYMQEWGYIFCEIRRQTGISTFIDSSKTAYHQSLRLYNLYQFNDLKIKNVFIFRSFWSSMQSFLSGSNRQIEKNKPPRAFHLIRSIVGWLVANFVALVYFLQAPLIDRYYVAHDIFLASPLRVLEALKSHFFLEFAQFADDSMQQNASLKHIVAGNRLARKKS